MDTVDELKPEDLSRIARHVARIVWSASGSETVSKVRFALASRDRQHFVAATVEALRMEWIDRASGSDLLHRRNPPPDGARMALVIALDEATADLRQ